MTEDDPSALTEALLEKAQACNSPEDLAYLARQIPYSGADPTVSVWLLMLGAIHTATNMRRSLGGAPMTMEEVQELAHTVMIHFGIAPANEPFKVFKLRDMVFPQTHAGHFRLNAQDGAYLVAQAREVLSTVEDPHPVVFAHLNDIASGNLPAPYHVSSSNMAEFLVLIAEDARARIAASQAQEGGE